MAVEKGQLMLLGYHVVKGTQQVVEPAAYGFNWPALGDGVSTSSQFTVDADYDFVPEELVHSVEGVATGNHVKLQVQIAVQNGRPWFITQAYINTISALQDAGRPRRLTRKPTLAAGKIVVANFYESTNL